MWKTGHSLIKSKMKETGAPLAGEMSGHIFFAHRWYGFDDALYAAVRLIEAVAKSGKSLTQLMDEMPKSVATPEMRFAVSSRKSGGRRVLERMSAAREVDATDGARVKPPTRWLPRLQNPGSTSARQRRRTSGADRLIGSDERYCVRRVKRTNRALRRRGIPFRNNCGFSQLS